MAYDDPLDSGGLGFLGGGGGGGWSDLLPLGAAAVGVLGGDQNAIGRMVPLMMSNQRYQRAEQMKTAEADDLAKLHGLLTDSITKAGGDAGRLADLFQENFGTLGLQTRAGQAAALKLTGEVRKDAIGAQRSAKDVSTFNALANQWQGAGAPASAFQVTSMLLEAGASPDFAQKIGTLAEKGVDVFNNEGVVTMVNRLGRGGGAQITTGGGRFDSPPGGAPKQYLRMTPTGPVASDIPGAVGAAVKPGEGLVEISPTGERVTRETQLPRMEPSADLTTGIEAFATQLGIAPADFMERVRTGDRLAIGLLSALQKEGRLQNIKPSFGDVRDLAATAGPGSTAAQLSTVRALTGEGTGAGAPGGAGAIPTLSGAGAPNLAAQIAAQKRQDALDYATQLGAAQTAQVGPQAQARQDVELGAPIGKEAENFTDPKTLEPARPGMPKNYVYNNYLAVPGKAVQAYKTVAQTIAEAREVIERRADLYPPSKGLAADALSVGGATAKFWAMQKMDPDIRTIKGLTATLPLQVRTFGDTGNIAVKEREIAAEASGLGGPMTREAALSSLDLMDRLVSESGSGAGLPSLRELAQRRRGAGGRGAPAAGGAGAGQGTRVRDPRTGRTGTVPAGRPIPPGLEVLR